MCSMYCPLLLQTPLPSPPLQFDILCNISANSCVELMCQSNGKLPFLPFHPQNTLINMLFRYVLPNTVDCFHVVHISLSCQQFA